MTRDVLLPPDLHWQIDRVLIPKLNRQSELGLRLTAVTRHELVKYHDLPLSIEKNAAGRKLSINLRQSQKGRLITMHNIQPLVIALLVAFSFTGPAVAHDIPQSYDRINLQVGAAEEVANDTLVAVMYSERSGQEPSAIADEVNRNISWAVDLAKKSGTTKVQTLHYRQDPLYKDQSISGWKIRQSIRLESTEAKSLGALIGEMQNRLSVASLQYTVSPARRDAAERRLIAEALNRFKRRSEQIELELGRTGYRIVNLDIITSGQSSRPVRMRAAAMMEDSAVTAPAIEPGVQTVSVQVSGTIELTLPEKVESEM